MSLSLYYSFLYHIQLFIQVFEPISKANWGNTIIRIADDDWKVPY